MLFGQSIFQSVLERLKAEQESDEEVEAPTAYRIHGFSTGLAFDVMEGVSAASQRPGQAYFDNLEPETPAAVAEEEIPPPVAEPEPEPVMPEHLARITPTEIAAELSLTAADTLQTLNEKRRAFAKLNHPDRVAPAFRENATMRMTLANLMIDEAVRRLGR